MPEKLAGYSTLAPLFYLYPQAPEFGQELYESGVRQLGWNKQKGNFVQAIDDPRWLSMVLMLAREIGDITTEKRLSAVAEQEFGPNFFGDDPDRFAWQFGLDEPYPRGQLNGLMILSEIGERGAWTDVYTGNYEPQFDLPTVEGVDYPSLGISEASNDKNTDQLLYLPMRRPRLAVAKKPVGESHNYLVRKACRYIATIRFTPTGGVLVIMK